MENEPSDVDIDDGEYHHMNDSNDHTGPSPKHKTESHIESKKRRKINKKKTKSPAKKKKTFKCNLCGKMHEFGSQEHMNCACFGLKQYECPFETCPTRFFRKDEKKRHIETEHMGWKPHRCSIQTCTNSFSNKRNLQRHINSKHTQALEYGCTNCSKKFFDELHLERHNVHACKSSSTQKTLEVQRSQSTQKPTRKRSK